MVTPLAEELALGMEQLTAVLFLAVRQVEVRAVVAELHSVLAREDVAGGVGKLAGQLTLGVAEEGAARRVGGVRVNPGIVQDKRVHDAAVAAGVHDVDLAGGGDRVQFLPARVALLGQVAVLIPVAADRTVAGDSPPRPVPGVRA